MIQWTKNIKCLNRRIVPLEITKTIYFDIYSARLDSFDYRDVLPFFSKINTTGDT